MMKALKTGTPTSRWRMRHRERLRSRPAPVRGGYALLDNDARLWTISGAIHRTSATPGPRRGGALKTRTHFAFRIDVWDDAANSIFEHVVGAEDFEVAEATYRAAVARWPAALITLRQGARVLERNWSTSEAAN
jgi:hypothetical protein